jgi:hypothetical protein
VLSALRSSCAASAAAYWCAAIDTHREHLPGDLWTGDCQTFACNPGAALAPRPAPVRSLRRRAARCTRATRRRGMPRTTASHKDGVPSQGRVVGRRAASSQPISTMCLRSERITSACNANQDANIVCFSKHSAMSARSSHPRLAAVRPHPFQPGHRPLGTPEYRQDLEGVVFEELI